MPLRRILPPLLFALALAQTSVLAAQEPRPTLRIGGKMVSERDFPANYSVRQMLNAWGRNALEIPYRDSLIFLYHVGDEALLAFEFTSDTSLTRVAYLPATAQAKVPTLLAGSPLAYQRSPANLRPAATAMPDVVSAWGLPDYTLNRTSDGRVKRWFYEFPGGVCAEVTFVLDPPFATTIRDCDPDPLRPRPKA